MHGFKIEDDGFEHSFEESPSVMLTDNGTTMTYLPKQAYEKLIGKICSSVDCFTRESDRFIYVRKCDSAKFEPIWFQLDTHWYVLPPNSYLIFILNTNEVTCFVRLAQNDKPYGILGANFLENYFQVYDVSRNTICLRPISSSDPITDAKGQNVIGFGEVKQVDEDGRTEQLIVSSVATVLTFLVTLLKLLLLYKEDRKCDN